eukprot:8785093-Pyramimonas_sp.AAC.1
MCPRNGVLGSRRPRSGLQVAPGMQNVAREWSSGSSKTTKWRTGGSGHPKCSPGMAFWERQDRFFEDVPGDLGSDGSRRILSGFRPDPPEES